MRLRLGNKGYSIVELFMVVAITILFGLTAYTLIISANDAYSRLSGQLEKDDGDRATISYVESLIRQNDREDAFVLEDSNTLRIKDGSGSEGFDKWLYFKDDALYEYIGGSDDGIFKDRGFVVIECNSFEISLEENVFEITINETTSYISIITQQGGMS